MARIKGQAQFCPDTTTYAPCSTYQTNVNGLLSSLSSNANQSDGLYNTTVGQNNPRATMYGLFLCPVDVTGPTCQECVFRGNRRYPRETPLDERSHHLVRKMLVTRYSNQSFFSTMQDNPMVTDWTSGNVSDQSGFTRLSSNRLSVVAKEAAYGGKKSFVTKEAKFGSFGNL
ncbi:putative cysteine-rich receptor-like protein kinase 9 [Prosopis cineraria]|uniref:putative cysteine-rich receptor-like protein kinase 9 n=1 Tax=Prosopis cineraria TaxID=364024 RepID=UPI00240FD098|nr:putative cysteine-rich receptor-like protein kinase 9 [Prosopis cineraria]